MKYTIDANIDYLICSRTEGWIWREDRYRKYINHGSSLNLTCILFSCSESRAFREDYWSQGRQVWTQGLPVCRDGSIKGRFLYSRCRKALGESHKGSLRRCRRDFEQDPCQTSCEITERDECYEQSEQGHGLYSKAPRFIRTGGFPGTGFQ